MVEHTAQTAHSVISDTKLGVVYSAKDIVYKPIKKGGEQATGVD